MILYHGSKEIVKFPEIRKAEFNKDFYFGLGQFTRNYTQTVKRGLLTTN